MNGNDQRRLIRRSKDAERKIGRWLVEHDGPDQHFKPGGGLVSTTGRVGHITGLQFDILTRSYAGEVKNIRLNKTWSEWWAKVCDKAIDQHKDPILAVVPSNDLGGRRKLKDMHIIDEAKHGFLLEALADLRDVLSKTHKTDCRCTLCNKYK